MAYFVTCATLNSSGGIDLSIDLDGDEGPISPEVYEVIAKTLRAKGYLVEDPYTEPKLKYGDHVSDAQLRTADIWVYLPDKDSSPGVSFDFVNLTRGRFESRVELPKRIKKLERPSVH